MRKCNVRMLVRARRCVRAISPVIATLLMIAIAVVASLVVFAWVAGYIGTQTGKAGQAIALPSFVVDPVTSDLHVYVQNVGQGTVKIGAVYVDDVLMAFDADPHYSDNQLAVGETADLTVPGTFDVNMKLNIKVTTTDGTFMTTVGGGTSHANSNPTVTPTSTPSPTPPPNPAWDFEDHTYNHYDLTTLTNQQIINEETAMNSLFAQHGLPPPIAIAYPSGYFNQAVINVISQYRQIGRTAGSGATYFPETYPVQEWYSLSSRNVASDTTLATAQGWIDLAVQRKGLLNLFFHQISDPADTYGCTPTMLGQVLDYLLAQQNAGNLVVMTMRQAYSSYNGQTAVVVLSFDDCFNSDFTVAYPMFQARGFAGTSFIVGSLVGGYNRLDWSMIYEMAKISPPA